MEIVIAAAVLAAGLVVAALLLVKRAPGLAHAGAAPSTARPASAPAKESQAAKAETVDALARREEIGRLEERLIARESAIDARSAELDKRAEHLEQRLEEAGHAHERHVRELERVSGLSASQAKHLLLKELEDQIRHDSARLVRQIEEETKRDADRRVRNILAVVMQRLAAGHAAETTVSVVQLPADDMKGRIIGREGRNIRALEHAHGRRLHHRRHADAVILSGFDGVRREIARLTLDKLLSDGRIHPARIEETVLPGQVRAREPHHRVRRAGDARRQRPGPRRRAGAHPRPPQVPHELRPERARAQHRVRAPGRDDGRGAGRRARRRRGGRRCCTTSARPSATRSKARTRSSAASWRAGTANPRPSRTASRPTTTRSSHRPSRR